MNKDIQEIQSICKQNGVERVLNNKHRTHESAAKAIHKLMKDNEEFKDGELFFRVIMKDGEILNFVPKRGIAASFIAKMDEWYKRAAL